MLHRFAVFLRRRLVDLDRVGLVALSLRHRLVDLDRFGLVT